MDNFFRTDSTRFAKKKLSKKVLDSIESKFGVCFPKVLITLLMKQNGGELEEPRFDVKGTTVEIPEIWSLEGIQPIVPEYQEHLALAKGKLQMAQKVFPFCGDGHYFLALDFRKSLTRPSVVYITLHNKVHCKKVADSFEMLLSFQIKPTSIARSSFNPQGRDHLIGKATSSKVNSLGEMVKCATWICIKKDLVVTYEHESWMTNTNVVKSEKWTRTQSKLGEIRASNVKYERKYHLHIDSVCVRQPAITIDESTRDSKNAWKDAKIGRVVSYGITGPKPKVTAWYDAIRKAIDET